MLHDRIGYVVKMYPRFSETFIVSEIIARERRGADIRIFSLRPTSDTRFHDTLAQVQAPVEQIPRVSKALDLWTLIRRAHAELPLLTENLGELLQGEHDAAAQAIELALAIRRRAPCLAVDGRSLFVHSTREGSLSRERGSTRRRP
jgi:hypothetical protein